MNPNLSPMAARGGRLMSVDAAKGVALICVMLGHTAAGSLVTYVDNMLLPLFWVAAGYTSRPDFRLGSRFRTLVVPYFLMSVVCMMFMLVIEPSEVGWRSVAGIFYSRFRILPDAGAAGGVRLMNVDNSVLWFLTSMFTAYCLFRLFLLIRSDLMRVFAAVVSVTLGLAYPYIPVLLPWSIDTAFFIAPLMLAGHMLRARDIIGRYWWPTFVISVLVYAVCNHFAGPTNYSIREMGTHYPASFGCALSGAVAALALFRRIERSHVSRAFAFVNAKALYIFGLQLVFIETGARLGVRFHFSEDLTVAFQILLAIIGGYVAGVLSERLVRSLAAKRFKAQG